MPEHRSPTNGSPDGASDGVPLSRRALLGGSAAAAASLAGCVGDADVVMGKRDESESTYDLASGTLRIDADYGEFAVQPASDDAVRVHVLKSGSLVSSLSSVSVSSERDGDAVVVRSSGDPGLFGGPDVEVQVELPPGVRVASAAVDAGGVLVEDVSVESGVTLRAGNGGAVARRVDGDVTVEAGNGGAVAEDVAGFATARAENGGAIVRNCEGVDAASTENGGVEADVTALRDDAQLSTRNGGVEAALSPNLDVRVVATAENGGVDLEGGPLDTSTVTGSRVEGTVGDGTHELRVETVNGGVTLSGPKDW